MPETIGIIAVGIPRGDLIDTLGQEVPEGVVDRGRMPLVLHRSGKASGEANLAVDAPQQEGTKVGQQGPASKSPRTVYPARGGKHSYSGVECNISKPLAIFTA